MARKTAAEAQETIKAISKIALHHFGQFGYAEASLEAIVKEAGVTRGALYHHFDSKRGLFEAVVAVVHQSIAAHIEEAAASRAGLWGGFVAGCHAWLAMASDPAYQRILIVDAPAVLGWERWLAADAEGGAALLRSGLSELEAAGLLEPLPIEALFHLLNGAMNQAALWIAQAEDAEQALVQARRTLDRLLGGIVRQGGAA